MSTTSNAGQWPPQTCEMPDLSGLNARISLLLVSNWALGGGVRDPKSNAYVMSFVRVVDKLVLDYERARAALTEYVSSPNALITPLIRATNECESCVSIMIRAINLGRRIRGDRNGAPVQRRIPVLSDRVSSKVTDMRNAIEHVDGQIADDAWVPGEPLCLLLKNDRLELAGVEIRYAELAEWTQQLNDIALRLAQYKEAQTGAELAAQTRVLGRRIPGSLARDCEVPTWIAWSGRDMLVYSDHSLR